MVKKTAKIQEVKSEEGEESLPADVVEEQINAEADQNETDAIIAEDIAKKSMEYNGIKLIGNYDVDADGRTPEQVTMVQNGMLRRILTGRIPAISCEEPSGNERFTDELNRGLTTGSAFGNVRIYGSKTRPAAKMLLTREVTSLTSRTWSAFTFAASGLN